MQQDTERCIQKIQASAIITTMSDACCFKGLWLHTLLKGYQIILSQSMQVGKRGVIIHGKLPSISLQGHNCTTTQMSIMNNYR